MDEGIKHDLEKKIIWALTFLGETKPFWLTKHRSAESKGYLLDSGEKRPKGVGRGQNKCARRQREQVLKKVRKVRRGQRKSGHLRRIQIDDVETERGRNMTQRVLQVRSTWEGEGKGAGNQQEEILKGGTTTRRGKTH